MTESEIWMVSLTAIYVAGTLLLLGTGAYQLYRYRRELRHQAVLHMAQSNREIIAIGLQHPELLELFRKTDNIDREKLSRYAQLWINQAHAIWHSYTIGHLSEKEWQPVRDDMLKMFETPIVRERWERAKIYYGSDFGKLIDDYLSALPKPPEKAVS